MSNNIKGYEKRINEQLNILCKSDKDTSHYKSAYEKLTILLYSYYGENIIGEKDKEIPGLELVETVIECIKYYDLDKGDFINYFITAFSRKIKQKEGKEIFDEMHGGIKCSRGQINKMKDALDSEEQIGPSFELSFYNQGIVSLDMENGDDKDGENSLYNYLSSSSYADKDLLQWEGIQSTINAIEKTYKSLVESQKGIVSTIMTFKVVEILQDDLNILDYAREMTFFSEEAYEMFNTLLKIPTSREIGNMLDKHEASISRTMHKFYQKVSEELVT